MNGSKIVRIILAAVAITVFEAVVGGLTCGNCFNWVYKLEPTNVWKPMVGPPDAIHYVGAVLLSLLFVLVYVLLHKGIPGPNRFTKGLLFGLCAWALGALPGMFAMYMFMTIHPTVLVYWTVMALIEQPIEGLIAAAIYGE